jgi:hypothetical protein
MRISSIRPRRRIGFGTALLLASAVMAGAMIETGEIKGKVRDENGAGLPGVGIAAAGPALQGVRTAVSSPDGDFHLPLLPVGTYTLTFRLQGFGTLKQENVIVRLGLTTTLAVRMTLAPIEKEIVVTAEVPLIDKTSVDTSYSLNAAGLAQVPAQNRTVLDAVKLAPGVTGVRSNTRKGTSAEGQPSVRGEGEEGNTWIVDGLAVSGVRMKNSGIRLNYDSLEEIQVISDPFSPEFGSAYGGIVNMVTKSGGNEFHGEASLVFQNRDLQAAKRSQLSVLSEAAYFSNANAYFDLGGPIVRDKLWFFLSENYYTNTEETVEGTMDYLFIPGGKRTTGNNNIFGKLTFALTPNHNFSATLIRDKAFPQTGATGLPEMNEERPYEDLFLRLNYKGILGPATFIEAGIGKVARKSSRKPVDGELGPAMYYIEDLAQNVHNSYGLVRDDEERLDASLKLSQYIESDKFGHHEIALGLEFYDVSSTFASDFSGRDEDPFPGNGFDGGVKINFDTWRNGQGTPTVLREYGLFSFVNSSRGLGLYLRDKATFGRLTLMAGLRSQTQVCKGDRGQTLWSWGIGDFLSPRLTASVDLTDDGKNVLKLGWGRFSDLITTMPLGFFNPGSGLRYRDYKWAGPSSPTQAQLHDPANWTFYSEPPTASFQVAPGIKPDFQSRWLVEFDRRLGPGWAVKARYVRTQAEKLLEILALFDLAPPNYKFVYDNFESKRRDYSGLEIEVEGRIGDRLFLNASYVHALARGTNPGQSESGSWSQDEGSTNFLGLFGNHIAVPQIAELADIKAQVDRDFGGLGGRGIGDEGWYGPLPYSVDDVFKLNAVYRGPLGIIVSTSFEYLSGYHWEKLGYVPGFGGYYAFPEGRGSRETPPHAYLDLSLEKTFSLPVGRIFPSAGLSVRLDVFNALNSQEPVSYVKENVPIFGTVWGRQQPRQARVSAAFRF